MAETDKHESKKEGDKRGGDQPPPKKPGGGPPKLELKCQKVLRGKDAWLLRLSIFDGSGKAFKGEVDICEGDKVLQTVTLIPGSAPVSIPFRDKPQTLDFDVKWVEIEDGKPEYREVITKPITLEGVSGGKGEPWSLTAIRADGSECYYVNVTVYHYQPDLGSKGVPALVDVLDGVLLSKGGASAKPVFVPPEGLTMQLPFERETRSAIFSARWVWEPVDQVYEQGEARKKFNFKLGCNPDMHTKSVELPGQPWSKVTKKPEPIPGVGFWGNFFGRKPQGG